MDTQKPNILDEFYKSVENLNNVAKKITEKIESFDNNFEILNSSLVEFYPKITSLKNEVDQLRIHTNHLNELDNKITTVISNGIQEIEGTKIQTELSTETIKLLKKSNRNISNTSYIPLALMLTSFLVMLTSFLFARDFYKTSVQTKSETMQEINNEMAKNGEKIYKIEDVKNLENNTTIIREWIKNNPKDSTPLLLYLNNKQSK